MFFKQILFHGEWIINVNIWLVSLDWVLIRFLRRKFRWTFTKHFVSFVAIFVFLFIIAKILLPIGASVCIIGGAD